MLHATMHADPLPLPLPLPAFPTADAAWAAVETRDRRYDDAFVYAVHTTGIYCRPTCPSRRPQRGNVAFFRTPAEAEQAGYRPCRRCRPHAATGAPTDRSVQAARVYLDRHTDRRVTLERLAREVGLSPAYLQRAFTRVLGLSPKAYHDARRREQLKTRLRHGATVLQSAYGAGFESSAPLYGRRGSTLGMTPGAYRRGGRSLEIRYGLVDCALGRLLVGATHRGVCSVLLGATDHVLESTLHREFPNATTVRDDPAVGSWADAIVRYVEGASGHPVVPLDLHGTAFQMRVWKALQDIPYGETRSYSAVAAAIGRPTAVRAVAHACATNHVALVVPCHRVIAANGGLGGYAGGVDRKRRLLDTEWAVAAGARAPAP